MGIMRRMRESDYKISWLIDKLRSLELMSDAEYSKVIRSWWNVCPCAEALFNAKNEDKKKALAELERHNRIWIIYQGMK